jgi:hypothetical protein
MTLFDNCIIQAPDGTNLSRCGKKKLQWYINRGMADLVADNPLTIRLRFEPSGRRGLDDPLLLDGKPNICVVCGTDENLTRHHIIPYSFIRHMELEYKVDIIRDIFPLCRSCHNDYEEKSQEKRHEMAAMLGVPINGIANEEIRRVRKVMGAAVAVIKHGKKMPPHRREELLSEVGEYLGKDKVTDDDLQTLKGLEITQRDDYINFSKYVVSQLGDYNDFAREWRTHFVETMKPKYMPAKWKIDRKTENVWVPARMLSQQSRR